MKKIVILSLIAPAVLGLAACGGNSGGNVTTANDTVTNIDDTNLTVENSATLNDTVPVENVTNAN